MHPFATHIQSRIAKFLTRSTLRHSEITPQRDSQVAMVTAETLLILRTRFEEDEEPATEDDDYIPPATRDGVDLRESK